MADAQLTLSTISLNQAVSTIWGDTESSTELFLIPPFVATITLFALLLRLAYRQTISGRSVSSGDVYASDIVPKPVPHGRVPTFLTILCCVSLLGIELYTTLQSRFSPSWIYVGLCATYAYTSLLGVLAFTFSSGESGIVITLLSTWSVYAYRDVWPLMTYDLKPLDAAEGPILWARIGILSLAAIVIPLTKSRQYVPYDPAEPADEPNPEQTASILSSMFFSYMTPVVLAASRTSHLALDQLPPLADVDHMKNLERRSFTHVDPLIASKRYIFWKLLHVFMWEHVYLLFLLLAFVVATLASPFAMNRILSYLEADGEGAVVHPWAWILMILIAPMTETVLAERYMWLVGRLLTQIQGILTQVIFDHALRIRVKTSSGDGSVQDTADISDSQSTIQGNESVTAVDETEPHQDLQSENDGASTVSVQSSGSKKGATPAADSKENNMVGKLNNLVTTDINALEGGTTFILVGFFTPCAIILSMAFLYQLLGWSVFVGAAVMVMLLMVPGLIVKLSHDIQVEKMKKSDSRVEAVTEALGSAMRMVKLFGWESKMSERIDRKRQEELKIIRKFRMLTLISNNISDLIPIITMAVTFATYTLIMKQILTASRVFSSMALFSILQNHFKGLIHCVPIVIQAKVSLDRIDEFLQKSEVLDAFANTTSTQITSTEVAEDDSIGIRAATFTWNKDTSGSSTPSSIRRNFKLQVDKDVFFKRGHINLVIGQTASGKTSLLMALLGEMHYIPMGPDSLVSLPRKKGVAYHAQESWVLNETIRNNILFGSPYNEERYKKVIKQCALERDLSLFDAGDETEVGEKGITLSGGQKARITLARAIYSDAEILLLDDVLAALDVHTSQWIVEQCFQGDLVKGRTVILVTHNVALASPIAEFVVALKDGRIISQGTLSNALEKDKTLSAAVKKETEEIEQEEVADAKTSETVVSEPSAGKLVVAEEISEGHVGWNALKLLLGNMGIGSMSMGSGMFIFWLLYILPIMVARIAAVLDSWVLGRWSHQYEIKDPSQVSVTYYLSLYMAVVLTGVLMSSIGYTVFVVGTVRASRAIHRTLIDTLLRATLRWLDKTPTSRIITRCTQDIAAIDGPVVGFLIRVIDMAFDIIIRLIAVVIISPVFVFPGLLVGAIMGIVGQLYMRAQLAVKRERSNARSPVLGHFGAAIAGLVSIRAYGAQAAFRSESFKRIDRYTRASMNYFNLNRWMLVRGESIVGMFAASLAAYLVYGQRESDASKTGFSLTMAIGFSTIITWWIRIFNEFEVSGNSLERVQQYLVIDQEPKPTPEGIPPAHWPSSGELRVENLSARYYEGGPKVLHDISFHVKSGERVGIVGRTGSGKSSLTLALLRCILTEGSVFFDGVPTDRVNLDALRSHITIIPQNPELLTGTLRENIDPFASYDDALLNDALRAAGLYSLQSDTEEGRLTLDSPISSGGGNLSVGQRQIIALARAIVRQSKLLILDEATSAIDYETDAVIQESLRREVTKDVTLLTVAHRLQTIMDADKIMVLDAGRIVEFGKPSELLENKKGFLRSLVDASGDKEKLYTMAGADVPLKDRLSKTLHAIGV